VTCTNDRVFNGVRLREFVLNISLVLIVYNN
jgi:hypothetical protein